VEPVQAVAEGLVKSSQVTRQYKRKPKLLGGLKVKVGQDVEVQVQLFMHIARIWSFPFFRFETTRYCHV
jgi:hypothetical protein